MSGTAPPGIPVPADPVGSRPPPAALLRLRDRAGTWGRRAVATGAGLPPWAQVLAVYVATRLFALTLVDRTSRFQPANLWSGADPGYLGMVSLWDGAWYRRIFEGGYPPELPLDADGRVRQNAWAFYPLFPLLCRAVAAVLGVGWPVAASLVAITCGALAVVLMRSLVEPVAGRRAAFWTVVLFCCHPAAPVLQLAYSESTAVLLLVAVLWCLQRRAYLPAVAAVLLLGLARPVAVPVAAVVGLHLLRRLWSARTGPPSAVPPSAVPPSAVPPSGGLPSAVRPSGGLATGQPLSRREGLALAALLVASVVAAALWPAVAALATGRPGAYTETMAAWRSDSGIVPVWPWVTYTTFLFGPVVGPTLLAVVLLAVVAWVFSPPARVLAGDLRAWCLCYLAYLLLVLDPVTSLVRYLLLLFPLGTLVVATSPSRAFRGAVAVAFLAGQIVWVVWLWRFLPPTDWPP